MITLVKSLMTRRRKEGAKRMKKKLLTALFISIFAFTREAYAVFDIMAQLQSALEQYKDMENKLEEMQKKLRDIEKKARQGFDAAKGCVTNPVNCNIDGLLTFAETAAVLNKTVGFYVMDGATALKSGDLSKVSEEALSDSVVEGYIFKRGQNKDLQKADKNSAGLNAVIAQDVATLFAKSISLRMSIIKEDGELYQKEFKNENKEEILNAQNIVSIASQRRLNHILMLKAYMISGPATAQLQQQNNREGQDND